MSAQGSTGEGDAPPGEQASVSIGRLPALVMLSLCVVAFVGLGLVQASRDAVTVDEAVDLAAGLVAVEHRDARMNPEHGLLHHVVPAVLPTLLADPVVPRTPAYAEGDWFDYTDDLVSANDAAGRLDEVVFWFRVAPLLVGALAGVLLYALAARWLGRAAGLIVAGLWLTTPYVIGLAHLSSLDVSFTTVVVAIVLLVDRNHAAPTDRNALALGAVLGLALLVRHYAVVLVPVVAAIAAATRWRGSRDARRTVSALATVLLVPILVVWLGYRAVDHVPVDGGPRDRFDGLVAAAAESGPVEAMVLAVPMPVEWRAGFAYLTVTAEERPAYLWGSTWEGGRPWYFPVTAALKLPVTVPVALLAGALGWWRASHVLRRRAVTVAGSVAGVLALFLLLQPLNLGLRLAVPVLAVVLLVGAGVVCLPRRAALAVVSIVAVGQVAASVVAHPTSLAWTPPPFHHGYRFLSDSSIDFGQANRAVARVHRQEPFTAAALLEPRGYDTLPGVPDLAQVDLDRLTGRVAVSATALGVVRADELSWLRRYCPVSVIDDAVLVYSFDRPPDTDAARGMPPSPCAGSVSAPA